MSISMALMFEVMDKEWPLHWIFAFFIGLGIIGFFGCRRWPALWFVLVPLLTLFAARLVAELTDPHLGEAIMKEAGVVYVIGAYVFMAAGVLLPTAGAYIGRSRRREQTSLP